MQESNEKFDSMDIIGYPSYEANRNGEIRNIETKLILKQRINGGGYKIIGLINSESKQKYELVHRLLGKMYVPNPDNKDTVDHINKDRSDNRIENLRWYTAKEQAQNRNRLKNTKKCRKVYQISIEDGSIIKMYNSLKEAGEQMKIDDRIIGRACQGKVKNAAGFIWKYCVDVDKSDEKEWRKVPFDPEIKTILYVTPDGDIKDKDNEKVIPYMNGGYLHVSVKTVDKKNKCFKVSRLVAMTFLDKPKIKKVVNHMDGVKTNNVVNNLEYTTQKENVIHAYKMGLIKKHSKGVIKLSLEGEELEYFSSIKEAAESVNRSATNVSSVCKGKYITAGGFKWKYA